MTERNVQEGIYHKVKSHTFEDMVGLIESTGSNNYNQKRIMRQIGHLYEDPEVEGRGSAKGKEGFIHHEAFKNMESSATVKKRRKGMVSLPDMP
jgi:hypothetical protein